VRRRWTRPGSAADPHRAWLELVDTDGPFLSVPAVKRLWSQGMPPPDADALAALKDAKPAWEKAWEYWDLDRDDDARLTEYRNARDAWVDVVLRDVLGWGERYRSDLTGVEFAGVARSPDYAVTATPAGALVHEGTIGALVMVVDPVDSLRGPPGDGWAASPIDRMEELLRTGAVPIGVVTDGRWWAIVSVREKTMVASGIVDAQTWIDEPLTRNAFIELLRPVRLIGGRPEDRLTELFRESVTAAEEITEALGVQVRRAVELLVQALSEAALDARRRGESDPLPANRAETYEAAVTAMMRVVFLLFAEERGLLPQSQLFALGYGISDELDELDRRLRDDGAETLDATHLTWHRLLATSQALYRGASFEDLRLPSYGGSLFDPDRYPFLTTRGEHGILTITVSDRVMVEVLRSVQIAQLRGQPAQRISFRDIDVEQIGYIYEGLLGYSSVEVDELTVGLIGSPGEEPEMTLTELERLAAANRTDAKLAEAILASVARNQPAAKPPSKNALAKAIRADVEDAERALRAVTTDETLRARLRPFIGIVRRDLRNRPHIVQPGGVLVIETPSRATAGAHYTPRKLAEEVVLHALRPLVFDPGPRDTAEEQAWRPVSSDSILDLKIADIACGSGAFLVAAARYLADRLVEAWHREGVAIGTTQELRLRAIREVVATCLYGADINPMAVEMCKLSLWLVSLDSKLPFSFVDDKVLHGNSLLGLTDRRQLETLHVTPSQASADRLFDLGQGGKIIQHLEVADVLAKAVNLRRRLATEVNDDDPQRSATTKRRQWREYQALTAQLRDIADGVVAAGLRLGGKPGKALTEAYENLRIAVGQAYPVGDREPGRTMLDAILRDGLTPTVETDYERWQLLHWVFAVPDVMEHGGFDAIIGNPPFLGGKKISPVLGSDVREWLVNLLASGRKGNADEVAYFFLRAFNLLAANGNLGLIGTNSLGQGDTREVGLDQMVAAGLTITRCVQSMTWPTSGANLEISLLWGTRSQVADNVPRVADDLPVARISTLLEPAGRVDGDPVRLAENVGIAFQGCIVLGKGFVLKPEEAATWIEADPHNAEVLLPYLNGEDLTSRPDCSASRWVIDLGERSEREARRFRLPWSRVNEAVRPERITKDGAKYPRMVNEWWKFWNARPAMRKAIASLDEVLIIVRHSRAVMPVRIRTGPVPSEATVVFATKSFTDQAVLSSSLHQLWVVKYGSTLETRVRYTPSAVFETFPLPTATECLHEIGQALDAERREMMLRRHLGLTKLYNLVNDPDILDSADKDVARLRQIHVDLDEAVMAAYDWDDVTLDHGFHTYRRMTRWTISPYARVEVFDRLLEENHRRAAAQGEAPPPADEDEIGGDE
jgi:methylase of polypeptide subunit release factors